MILLNSNLWCFFVGFVCGIGFVIFGVWGWLSSVFKKDRSTTTTISAAKEYHENEATSEEKETIDKAIRYISELNKNLKVTDDDFNAFAVVDSMKPSGPIDVIDKEYNIIMKSFRDRCKNVKSLSNRISDVSKAINTISKDLSKISIQSFSHSNKSLGVNSQKILGGMFTNSDVDPLFALWWSILGTFLTDMGDNFNELVKASTAEVSFKINTILDKITGEEKSFQMEGTKAIASLKEAISLVDRFPEKSKQHELALGALNEAQENYYDVMNKIYSQSQIVSAQALFEIKAILIKMGQKIRFYLRRIVKSSFNYTLSIEQSSSRDDLLGCNVDWESKSAELCDKYISPEYSKVSLIFQSILRMLRSLEAQSKPTLDFENSSDSRKDDHLDMSSFSVVSLAAISPKLFLKDLPPTFSSFVRSETCVWFNAFSGRVYRDVARSAYFNAWFGAKVAQILNRGQRPDYFDAFKVDNVQFGAVPPILSDVKWSPQLPKSTKVDINDERYNFWESSETGDFDTACIGNINFSSGLQFDISTRIWINWPRDHAYSIPLTLKLELAELSGRIIFGVRRDCSFLSFTDEPLTHFKVNLQLFDKNLAKYVPSISDFLISKMKKSIANRFVYPSVHKFRLIWPRHWWPEEAKDLFQSEPINVDGYPESNSKSDESSKITSYSLPTTTTDGSTQGSKDQNLENKEAQNVNANAAQQPPKTMRQRLIDSSKRFSGWSRRSSKKTDPMDSIVEAPSKEAPTSDDDVQEGSGTIEVNGELSSNVRLSNERRFSDAHLIPLHIVEDAKNSDGTGQFCDNNIYVDDSRTASETLSASGTEDLNIQCCKTSENDTDASTESIIIHNEDEKPKIEGDGFDWNVEDSGDDSIDGHLEDFAKNESSLEPIDINNSVLKEEPASLSDVAVYGSETPSSTQKTEDISPLDSITHAPHSSKRRESFLGLRNRIREGIGRHLDKGVANTSPESSISTDPEPTSNINAANNTTNNTRRRSFFNVFSSKKEQLELESRNEGKMESKGESPQKPIISPPVSRSTLSSKTKQGNISLQPVLPTGEGPTNWKWAVLGSDGVLNVYSMTPSKVVESLEISLDTKKSTAESLGGTESGQLGVIIKMDSSESSDKFIFFCNNEVDCNGWISCINAK